ncbi:MAG: archaemetzincin family Zn-dependent metalloprotease [Halobacteria archaeon]|nr:archaemetzincin family Zn-dependent metalloprotease [Halobacteria archaeon]
MRIDVVPVGDVDGDVLDEARDVLIDKYDADPVVRSPVPVPNDAYDSQEGQYNAERLIDLAMEVGGGNKNVAVTSKDLFYRKRNYVFGLAYLNGEGCVVSTHRLRMSADGGERIEGETVLDRVRKEVVHEVGHTLGLQHCDNEMCVMSFSQTVEGVDTKFERTCPRCNPSL